MIRHSRTVNKKNLIQHTPWNTEKSKLNFMTWESFKVYTVGFLCVHALSAVWPWRIYSVVFLQNIIINFFFKYSTCALSWRHNGSFFGQLTKQTLNDTTHYGLNKYLCIFFFYWGFPTLAFLWHLFHELNIVVRPTTGTRAKDTWASLYEDEKKKSGRRKTIHPKMLEGKTTLDRLFVLLLYQVPFDWFIVYSLLYDIP